MKTKTISILLAACMMVGMLPYVATAQTVEARQEVSPIVMEAPQTSPGITAKEQSDATQTNDE